MYILSRTVYFGHELRCILLSWYAWMAIQVWHGAHGRFYAEQDGLGGVVCLLFSCMCVCFLLYAYLVFTLYLSRRGFHTQPDGLGGVIGLSFCRVCVLFLDIEYHILTPIKTGWEAWSVCYFALCFVLWQFVFCCICAWHRVAKTHRMPNLYTSFSTKEPHN